MRIDPYNDPNCDQEALDHCRTIREEWKSRQPDPECMEDVLQLLESWRASPEAQECRRILARELEGVRP